MRFIIASAVALVCASCSPTPAPPTPQTPPAAVSQGPIITQIASRDKVLIVRAGATEPTYTLQTKAGAVIVPAMTLGDLALNNPQLAQTVRTMQAAAICASADAQ
jgi:hypothetical protein